MGASQARNAKDPSIYKFDEPNTQDEINYLI